MRFASKTIRIKSAIRMISVSLVQASRSFLTRFSNSGMLSFCGHFARQAPQFTHTDAGAPRWSGDSSLYTLAEPVCLFREVRVIDRADRPDSWGDDLPGVGPAKIVQQNFIM